MLGYTKNDLIGRSFRMLYATDEEFDRICDIGLKSLMDTGSYFDERVLQHHDGFGVWVHFRARALNPGDPRQRSVLSYSPIDRPTPRRSLSARERDVIAHMSEGLTSKEIAQSLGLSPRTIEDVRSRLARRFGVRRSKDVLAIIAREQEK